MRGLREAFPHLKWRHQAPVGPVPFYADILCFSENLVIEIDGDSHTGTERYDSNRTALIEREGYRVIRFTNSEVMSNLEGVLTAIAAQLKSPSPPGADAPGPFSQWGCRVNYAPRSLGHAGGMTGTTLGRAAQPRRGEGDPAANGKGEAV